MAAFIQAADYDSAGFTTSSATKVRAHNLANAQGYMLIQAGDMLQSVGRPYRVAVLEPRHIRLERRDRSGGTYWTITDD